MDVRRGNPPPPCPPPPRRSNIPVRVGPNAQYHRPVMSYERPIPPPPPMPFRYQMVPGRPGRLQRMHPQSFYQQIAQNYPDQPSLSMRELINLHPGTRPWFRAGGMEGLQSQRNRPPMVAGERATGFESICGTDPSDPYGGGWRSQDFEDHGERTDDPSLFEISSTIPEHQPGYDWETMEQVQNERIEAVRTGVDWVQENWRNAFQDDTWRSDDWGCQASDVDDDEQLDWASAQEFIDADMGVEGEVALEQGAEMNGEVNDPGGSDDNQVYELDVIYEEPEDDYDC